jgi:hypothetical protein
MVEAPANTIDMSNLTPEQVEILLQVYQHL